MNAFEKWYPIKFDPEGEQAYFRHMLERTLPLARLGCFFGLFSFVGYQFWDLLLDPQALYTTGPLRVAMVFFFIICIGLTLLPAVRSNPKYLPFVVSLIYLGVAVGFALILSHLPGGFVAGNAGFR